MSSQSSERDPAFCACLSLLAVLLCSRCHGQDVASIEKVWRERSGRITEIHLTWTEQVTHHNLPGVTHGGGEYARSVEGRSRRVCDSYVERNAGVPTRRVAGAALNPDRSVKNFGKTFKQRSTTVFDGVTSAGIYDALDEDDYPKGSVTIGLAPRESLDARFQAIQLFCRPFDKAFGFPDGLSGIEARPVELDGEQCLHLMNGANEYWVTSDERHLLLRRLEKRVENGTPLIDLRVQYSKDAPSGEWLPSGWVYKLLGADGKVVGESRIAKVTEASVHNPLPVDLFWLQIPDGAWIREFNGVNQTEYIHRSKKGPRFLSPGELNDKNYKELLNSDTPVAKPAGSSK